MENQILCATKLNFNYGSSTTLVDINFDLNSDDILALVGRNGVGKTTLLKCIMGINKAKSGNIDFYGETALIPTYKLSEKGMAYVPQGRDIFPDFTVLENLKLGVIDYKEKKQKEKLEQILEYFPALNQHLNRMGGVLSGGQQQQLAIARALMTSPKLLLLDEPTEGIQPNVVAEIMGILKKVHDELDLPIIVVEQNLNFIKNLCNKFICLQKGNLVAGGTIDELTQDVIDKYLVV